MEWEKRPELHGQHENPSILKKHLDFIEMLVSIKYPLDQMNNPHGMLLDTNYIVLYVCAFTIFGLIYQTFHDIGLSTLLTFAVLIQVLALAALL